MKEGVKIAIAVIAQDLFEIINEVFTDDAIGTNIKVGINTLIDSNLRKEMILRYNFKGADPVIETLFNHYIESVEKGRKPKTGSPPPISDLVDWAKRRGIPTDSGTLFAISYAIWRDGYAGRPVIATIESKLDLRFNDKWADMLFEAITESLTEFFND